MSIYILNLALIGLWYLFIHPEKTTRRKRVFCLMCSLQMGLIAGFRADFVTKDGTMYHGLFNGLQIGSLQGEIENVLHYLTGSSYLRTDPGFYLFEKVLQTIGCDWHQTVLLISLITTFLFAHFVIKESTNPAQSYLIYATIFFPFVSMMAMRQGLALSLALFVGYPLARERRLPMFLIVVVVAFLFHKSAIFAAPIYFLQGRPFSNKVFIGSVIAFLLLIPVAPRILLFANALFDFGGDYSTAYVGTRTLVYVLGMGGVWLVAVALRGKISENNLELYDSLLWLLTVGLMFCAAAFTNSNALRAGYYYLIPSVLLIPMVIDALEDHIEVLTKIAMPAICVLFVFIVQPLVMGSSYYLPYWMV